MFDRLTDEQFEFLRDSQGHIYKQKAKRKVALDPDMLEHTAAKVVGNKRMSIWTTPKPRYWDLQLDGPLPEHQLPLSTYAHHVLSYLDAFGDDFRQHLVNFLTSREHGDPGQHQVPVYQFSDNAHANLYATAFFGLLLWLEHIREPLLNSLNSGHFHDTVKQVVINLLYGPDSPFRFRPMGVD